MRIFLNFYVSEEDLVLIKRHVIDKLFYGIGGEFLSAVGAANGLDSHITDLDRSSIYLLFDVRVHTLEADLMNHSLDIS